MYTRLCRLIAAGRTPSERYQLMRKYDSSGPIWAYVSAGLTIVSTPGSDGIWRLKMRDDAVEEQGWAERYGRAVLAAERREREEDAREVGIRGNDMQDCR